MNIEAFVRFTDVNGHEYCGKVSRQQLSGELTDLTVNILEGTPYTGFQVLEERKIISKVLCPLKSTPYIICIGLNYKKHAEESRSSIPEYPVVFTKPPDALTGPYDTISIHPAAQTTLDYEGELTIVIGRDARNVSASEAFSCILGYTNGNDVSARIFQLPHTGGGQFCYAKSFDAFAPIGPAIVLANAVPDLQNLNLSTKVNGAVRQETSTDDMIWSVAKIVEHLSRGTTLRKGTIIMTGTPSGVGCFMKPTGYIGDGDIVEVRIEGFGKLANQFVFENRRDAGSL
ncbi:hypothetical protein LTR10_017721 [Elasticomyces elasticus]|uniref:Fumarylacetoacetase-like C-terminal domain-containing protein n=1 Tax=Exophiala sideris TaxID=1016849 RepID=A0ABR0JBF1_9EURO|nr:hypothetical protein LTR10_017721 [Elasticomyces elasticus]KAK5031030.1 hypothetical protein LTS07_004765 [Exophiala sideris]KAK5038752.1 hypothetical protein LTR13_003783 [Exophiala sideris]KAK5060635.1 hypothetical protein LTR69_005234 [Exophiala sideris]KAK5183548.1 hypothetical protein LTR44_003830 [Eurotiomycetes sp. CCFEE 6388]